jgi:hypothetical protein
VDSSVVSSNGDSVIVDSTAPGNGQLDQPETGTVNQNPAGKVQVKSFIYGLFGLLFL